MRMKTNLLNNCSWVSCIFIYKEVSKAKPISVRAHKQGWLYTQNILEIFEKS